MSNQTTRPENHAAVAELRKLRQEYKEIKRVIHAIREERNREDLTDNDLFRIDNAVKGMLAEKIKAGHRLEDLLLRLGGKPVPVRLSPERQLEVLKDRIRKAREACREAGFSSGHGSPAYRDAWKVLKTLEDQIADLAGEANREEWVRFIKPSKH